MSKKRTPARSGTSSPSAFTNTPSLGGVGFGVGFVSASSSVLSFVAEPPDLSQISDPSVAVLFKSLSKKEEVTKNKALDGLLAAVEGMEAVEEGVLSAWVFYLLRSFFGGDD